ncbi:hypothetical protein [Caballeronia sp. Sq4a]|uniref:hypothetical protein n=1 Tax=Caballeronia sp. Sq4a TaxID=2878152 RepID=UPI0020BD6199|nr:hypothetical protein [Caballeronia sp. Sq4a]
MPTAKARYTARYIESAPESLSEKAKCKLRDLYRLFSDQSSSNHGGGDFVGPPEMPWGEPTDHFVQVICAEIHWAAAELQEHKRDINKGELMAEHDDFLRSLRAALKKAQDRSPEYRRLYPTDVDVVSVLDHLVASAEVAGAKIPQLPKVRTSVDKAHTVLVEMAIRVLRVVKQHGIPVTATADVDMGRASPAVEILKVIGDDLKLLRSPMTLRDVIIAAQKSAPDLVPPDPVK